MNEFSQFGNELVVDILKMSCPASPTLPHLVPPLHLEPVHVSVEHGGLFAILDTGAEPHEEVDVVVIAAVPEAEVVLHVHTTILHAVRREEQPHGVHEGARLGGGDTCIELRVSIINLI